MSEFTDTLTQKAGPLPVWAWGAIAGGGIVVFRFVKARSGDSVDAPSEFESAEDADSPEYYAPYSPDLLTRTPTGGAVDIPYYNPPETVTVPTAGEIAEEIARLYPVPEPAPPVNPLRDFVDAYSVLFPLFQTTPQATTPATPAPVNTDPIVYTPAPAPAAPVAPRPPVNVPRTNVCGVPKGTVVWSGKNKPNMATLRAANPNCALDDRERGGGLGWVVVVV